MIDAAAVVANAHATIFVANARVVVDIVVIMMLMVYVSKVNHFCWYMLCRLQECTII